MEPARPRSPRRRPRRGSLERPLDARLVRTTFLLVAVPLLLLLFTGSRPGPLAAPQLPPAFDAATATSLARELATDFPTRVPGGPFSAGAASWFEDKLALYGIDVSVDTWTERVPDLGDVTLRNVTAVVPGETSDAIVVVAHRDTTPAGPGANDNASGTAALIELARAYAAPTTSGQAARPRHTLVLLSADGGAYGGVGAARFADSSPLRDRVLVAVSLDGIAAAGTRLDVSGDAARSPAPGLVRTAAERVREHTGAPPALPSPWRQLVELAIPFGYGDQAPFLGGGVSALRLTTTDDAGAGAGTDLPGALDEDAVAQNGRAAEALLGSLDGGIELAQGTPAAVYLESRVLRGWAIGLVLVALVAPFVVGVVDLLAHCHRRRVALGPAARALALRLVVAGWIGALLALSAAAGFLPTGSARPLPPDPGTSGRWSVAGLALFCVLAVAGWLVVRRRLRGAAAARGSEEELAGHAVALALLAVLTVVVAVVHSLALVFLLPSLYAWLFLVQVSQRRRQVGLYALGFAGPLAALLALASRLDLGIDVLLYAVGLVSVGYVPWFVVASALVWAAAGMQTAAIVAGRYAPVERTGWPSVLSAARRGVPVAQSRRR